MMLKSACLTVFVTVLLLFCACSGQSETGILSPCQVEPSMVDQVITVKGRITTLTVNPGGLGGIYLLLDDNKGEVGVRIQEDVWQTFNEEKKAEFKEGRAITAEGVLFQAGNTLVIVYGKDTTSTE